MGTCKSDGENKNCPLKILSWIGFAIGGIGVGYFFWIHKAHVLQYIPFGLLLLCPLMHLFGGHGNHGPSKDDSKHNH